MKCPVNAPFFLKTKEDPIRRPETRAKIIPTILNCGGLVKVAAPDAVAVAAEVAVVAMKRDICRQLHTRMVVEDNEGIGRVSVVYRCREM